DDLGGEQRAVDVVGRDQLGERAGDLLERRQREHQLVATVEVARRRAVARLSDEVEAELAKRVLAQPVAEADLVADEHAGALGEGLADLALGRLVLGASLEHRDPKAALAEHDRRHAADQAPADHRDVVIWNFRSAVGVEHAPAEYPISRPPLEIGSTCGKLPAQRSSSGARPMTRSVLPPMLSWQSQQE